MDSIAYAVADGVIERGRPREALEALAQWIEKPSPHAHWHWLAGARATLATTTPARAFERLSPALGDLAFAERVLDALVKHDGPIDARWFTAAQKYLQADGANSGGLYWKHAADPEAVRVVIAELERFADADPESGYFFDTVDDMNLPAFVPALVKIVRHAARYTDWRFTRPLDILARLADASVVPELHALTATTKGKAKTALAAVLQQLDAKFPGAAPAAPPARTKKPPKVASPLAQRLVDAGLSAERANAIDKIARPRIDLAPKRVKSPEVGTTRFGGEPDLPAKTGWPHVTCTAKNLVLAPAEYPAGTLPAPDAKGRYEVPLAFVAQIDLADLAEHDEAKLLPATGTLWFFARQEVVVGEKRDLQQIAAHVIYAKTAAKLSRTSPPATLPKRERYTAASVTITHSRPLPPPSVAPLGKLALAGVEHDAFETARRADPPSTTHAVLGWADAAYFQGIPEPKDQLLLRVGSDAVSGFEWGDAASIFFVIPSKALEERDFTKAYCLMDE